MSKGLQLEHPDFYAKVGDTRTYNDRIYCFSENQYSSFWKSGPKDGTIACSKDYPYVSPNPYIVVSLPCKTFEDAAERAIATAEREYLRAKKIVESYERVEEFK